MQGYKLYDNLLEYQYFQFDKLHLASIINLHFSVIQGTKSSKFSI